MISYRYDDWSGCYCPNCGWEGNVAHARNCPNEIAGCPQCLHFVNRVTLPMTFYGRYLAEHRNAINRFLHAAGVFVACWHFMLCFAFGHCWHSILAPVIAYGFAWVGHVVFERNRPLTFSNPFKSFVAYWRMIWETIRG